MSPTDSINTLKPLNAPIGATSSDTDRSKIQAMAQQFESLLLAQMMREMKQSMAPESDEQGLGGSIMGDTFLSELGLALSRAGGVGMSKVLVDGFTKNLPVAGEVENAGAASSLLPLTPGDVADLLPLTPKATSMKISSDFGWRNDPIDGRQRFHAGTDLRLAYGRDVRAAAAGVVTFAGNQGGYGTSVTVRHSDGIETRYAHLSAMDVREGDQVSAGQVIARSGNTGRTTGPHLHFEVRQNGRPVDPDVVEGLISVEELGGDAGH
jgi:murein DD-endopeptidase MepM/ murein hydrolase activator NlpD